MLPTMIKYLIEKFQYMIEVIGRSTYTYHLGVN